MTKVTTIAIGIILVLVFVTVAVIGIFGLQYWNKYNPSFQGKRLYTWADQAVSDDDPAARRKATQALLEAWPDLETGPKITLSMRFVGEEGVPLPKEVLPFLIEALKSPDIEPGSYPAMALQRGKGPDTVPALKKALKNEHDPNVRMRIQLVLDRLNSKE